MHRVVERRAPGKTDALCSISLHGRRARITNAHGTIFLPDHPPNVRMEVGAGAKMPGGLADFCGVRRQHQTWVRCSQTIAKPTSHLAGTTTGRRPQREATSLWSSDHGSASIPRRSCIALVCHESEMLGLSVPPLTGEKTRLCLGMVLTICLRFVLPLLQKPSC